MMRAGKFSSSLVFAAVSGLAAVPYLLGSARVGVHPDVCAREHRERYGLHRRREPFSRALPALWNFDPRPWGRALRASA